MYCTAKPEHKEPPINATIQNSRKSPDPISVFATPIHVYFCALEYLLTPLMVFSSFSIYNKEHRCLYMSNKFFYRQKNPKPLLGVYAMVFTVLISN